MRHEMLTREKSDNAKWKLNDKLRVGRGKTRNGNQKTRDKE